MSNFALSNYIYNFTGVHRSPSVPSRAQTKSGLGDLMNSLRLGQTSGVISIASEKAVKHCTAHCITSKNANDCDCLYFFLLACILGRAAGMPLILLICFGVLCRCDSFLA